jgi:PAS domain S-box-containing protein
MTRSRPVPNRTRHYEITSTDRRVRNTLAVVLGVCLVGWGGYLAHLLHASQQAFSLMQAKADKEALRAELTITSSPYANLMTTDHGVIVQSNLAAELLTGYQHSELIGKSAIDLLVPEKDRDQVTSDMHQSVSEMREYSGNWFVLQRESHVPILHKDGHEVQVIVSIRIIKFMGEIQFIVGMRAESPEEQPIQPQQQFPIPEIKRGVNTMLDRAMDQMAAEYKQD